MSDYLRWLRERVGHHLVPLVYATAIVRDEGGRILFQRRADFGEAWWGLPGGLFEPGETPAACVQREVYEETGLRVEPTRLTGVYSSPRYNVTYPNGDKAQQITLCYECRIVGGDLRPDGDEILGLELFAPSALPPCPPWYADMADHATPPLASSDTGERARPAPYFDPPEHALVATPFPTLMSVRRVVGTAPFVWAGASAAVLDEAGRILLQRRSDNGTWGLPAGALDAGETLAQTVIRETREETGLHVEPVAVIDSYAGYEITFPNGDRLFPVGTLFACRVVGGQLRADGHESTEVGFFAPDDLPPLPTHIRGRVQAALAVRATGL